MYKLEDEASAQCSKLLRKFLFSAGADLHCKVFLTLANAAERLREKTLFCSMLDRNVVIFEKICITIGSIFFRFAAKDGKNFPLLSAARIY